MKVNLAKIRAALCARKDESAASWRDVRRAVAALNDAELAEAEIFERDSRRRMEVLRMLEAEKRKRAGFSPCSQRTPKVAAFL
jgi:hypothetical protein